MINRSSLFAFVLVIGLFTLSMLWLISYIPVLIKNNAEREAVNSAKNTAFQYKTLRTYYTKNVIHKIVDQGTLIPSVDHKNNSDRVPLPATMIHDLSKLMEPSGSRIKLYSEFPFPNRSGKQLDDFGQKAWNQLQIDPSSPFFRTEKINNKTFVRVGIADIMTESSCVDCHNHHPVSPKTDWKLGDLRGVLEVDLSIDDQLAWAEKLSNQLLITLILVLIFLIVIFAWFADYSSTKMLNKEKQLEALNIYNSMLKANQHIFNNLLNQMQLFEIEAENSQDFNPEILKIFNQSLDEAKDLFYKLSQVDKVTGKEIWASVDPAHIAEKK